MWSFFKSKAEVKPLYKTDIHSHLLPGIDDGVKTLQEAEQVINILMEAGLSKAITTPHIIIDQYRNTPAIIRAKAAELNDHLLKRNIPFVLEAAAEYMFDESVFETLMKGEELLTFAGQYLLFETNTYAEPINLNDFIFRLKVKGYIPVMAHPERYKYLYNNLERAEDLQDRGVLFQVNALSLMGNYSKPVQKVAIEFLNKKMIHFIGTDCHGIKHAQLIKTGIANKYFQQALELPLLNYSI